MLIVTDEADAIFQYCGGMIDHWPVFAVIVKAAWPSVAISRPGFTVNCVNL